MKRFALTRKQREVYEFYRDYWQEHKVCPSYREVALACGRMQLSSVHRYVHGLIERGALKQEPGFARSLSVVPEPPETVQGAVDALCARYGPAEVRRAVLGVEVPVT